MRHMHERGEQGVSKVDVALVVAAVGIGGVMANNAGLLNFDHGGGMQLPRDYRQEMVHESKQALKEWGNQTDHSASGVENSNPAIAKFTDGNLGSGVSWCAYFTQTMMERAGVKVNGRKVTATVKIRGNEYWIARVASMRDMMADPHNDAYDVVDPVKLQRGEGIKPGDIAFINWHGSKTAFNKSNGNHVGIVIKVKNGEITYINGNSPQDGIDYGKIAVGSEDLLYIGHATPAKH